MTISCICTTFGRSKILPQAVQSFCRQNYNNKELIIVNSCPQQKYFIDNKYQNIKIINLYERPNNYARCFDIGVNNSYGDLIVPWDDDDIYLPQYLDNYIYSYNAKNHWIRQHGHFSIGLFGNQFKYHDKVCAHTIMYSRQSYNQIGSYQSLLNAGQSNKIDQIFTNKLLSYSGICKKINTQEISFVYRYKQIPFHYSQYGNDSYMKIGQKVKNMLKSGQQASGSIQILPKWEKDYESFRSNIKE